MKHEGMSHKGLIKFKLQHTCSSEDLMKLSLQQMFDMAARPDLDSRDPERIELIKWLYKDDWQQHMDTRFKIKLR